MLQPWLLLLVSSALEVCALVRFIDLNNIGVAVMALRQR